MKSERTGWVRIGSELGQCEIKVRSCVGYESYHMTQCEVKC